jgi:hypothetical protein
MKLAALRKLAIRNQVNIRFPIANGMECVVGADGVARVPGLQRAPDFNLEQELGSATQFLLEPVAVGPKAPPPKRVTREELSGMAEPSMPAAAHDHEEE